MNGTLSPERGKRLRTRIFFIATNVISVICLAWTLHGASLGRLRNEIAHLDWRWVLVAMSCDILVYVVQAWRWLLVLRPVTYVSLWTSVRAIYVGLFANEVLPLRAGEIIRCFLLSRWTKVPVSVTLASALIERIFDGVWLVVCLFLTLKYVHLPKQFVAGGIFLAALLAVCAVLLGFAMFYKQQTLDLLLDAKWLSWVHVLIADLHLIGHSRYLYYALLVSMPYLLLQVLPVYAMIRSYHQLSAVPLGAAFAMTVLLRLGSVIPQGPGNVGTFNGITVIGLRLFAVPTATAKRFSILLWAAVTLPLLMAGFIAVAITGVKMGELHGDARAHMRKRESVLED
ncbi:MAG: flippase-like domain-containing protein [Acidobacteriota bacterium]|nr:flippase-like domain-containing protein [Acidobacteriota bacterium]